MPIIPNPEVAQSSGNMLHLALEVRNTLSNPNLFNFLKDIGHPYGILVQPLINQMGSTAPLWWYSVVLSSSSFDAKANNPPLPPTPWTPQDTSAVVSLGLSSSAAIGNGSLLESSSEGSQSSSESIAEKIEKKREKKELSFNKNKSQIIFGSVTINLRKYLGQEPYVIKTPQGEAVVEVQPQAPLAFIHLNRQRKELRQMSALEKIQKMKRDLITVFGLMDNEALLNSLKPEQQAVLTAIQSAVMVGISHLVPFFRHRTGLPAWKLDVLPQAVQQLHRLDSQMVSDKFGGKRQVRVEDVEMMVLTPEMRRGPVAAQAQL